MVRNENNVEKTDMAVTYQNLRYYDLSRPRMFTKLQEKETECFCQSFLQGFAFDFSLKNGKPIKLDCDLGCCEIFIKEFLESIENDSFMFFVRTNLGDFIIHFLPELSHSLLKQADDTKIEICDLQALRSVFADDFIGSLLNELQKKIKTDVELLDLVPFTTTSCAPGGISTKNSGFLVTILTKFLEKESNIELFLCKNFIENLKRQEFYSDTNHHFKSFIMKQQDESQNYLVAEFNRAPYSALPDKPISDGDTIILPHNCGDSLNLVFDGKIIANCEPFTTDETFAVRVNEIFPPEKQESVISKDYVALQFGKSYVSAEKIATLAENLKEGMIIELNRSVGQPSELVCNDEVVAMGDIIVHDGKIALYIPPMPDSSFGKATLIGKEKTRYFSFIRKENPENVFKTLQKEDDYFIALVLSCISSDLSSSLFGKFDLERQVRINEIIANGLKISSSVIKAYEKTFAERLKAQSCEEKLDIAGTDIAREILRLLKAPEQKDFIASLSVQNEELAMKLKESLFFFDDIPILWDRDIQKVLREVDNQDLAKALKGASESVCTKFYRNMSKRAVKMLKEDMEFMGPIRIKDIQETQQMIVNIILKLEEMGEIVIQRAKDEEVL